MAAGKTSKSVIDNLPEVQRRKVVDALLAGQSLREVSRLAGVSAPSVNVYKKKVVMPALRAAQQVQAFQPLASTNKEQLANQAALTRDIVRASPFRERLESLWGRTERNLGLAEEAEEYGNVAKLLSVAQKNTEILGRATGELEVATGANIAIQIVLPGEASSASPAFDFDITATK